MGTHTLHLNDREDEVLADLCKQQDMSKAALLRQCLRLYQVVHNRLKDGEQLAFTKDGKVIPQVIVGLPKFD